jgi:hypothetical protein
MPLWKLQTLGQERVDFLYENAGAGHVIELRPGVAYCFRKFHALISDQVRGAWLRYVRQQNLDVLGEAADLNDFLFGSERNNLALVRPVLMDLQRGRCFYCRAAITGTTAHVDHFIAWSRSLLVCPTSPRHRRRVTKISPRTKSKSPTASPAASDMRIPVDSRVSIKRGTSPSHSDMRLP